MGDNIFPSSFEDGLVEKFGVPVANSAPVLFEPLSVVGFFFSKDVLMLVDKIFLKVDVALGGGFSLEGKEFAFNQF